jgi:hypothetical protein
MSEKKNNIFVRILRWFLEEWIKALLLATATLVLGYVGWIYRKYINEMLTSKYYFETYGWAWIGLFLLIVILFVLVFWLITRKSKGNLIKDENAIKHILEMSWEEMKEEDFESGKELYSFSGIDESPFKSSLLYNKPNRLKPGSAEKYLPEIINEEEHYRIESIEGNSIIIVCTHRK